MISYTYGTGVNRDRIGTVTYGNGNTVTYSYDEDNDITGISYDSGTNFAYQYTYTDGVLTSITDNQSGYVTTYTDDGKTKITKGSVTLFETGYDNEDNYTETSNGTVYTYTNGDSDYDQATGVSNSTNTIRIGTGSNKISFASSTDWFDRDISSSMTAVGSSANFGSVSHSFTYKGNAMTATQQVDTFVSTVRHVSGTTTDTVYGYTYDNNGNIRTITKGNNLQYTYNYDEAGQLVRVDDAVHNKTFTYIYDVGGNISAKKEYAYTTGTLGSVVDTISYTYDNTWKDKLTSYDGDSITYDAIGNPLTYNDYIFEWNSRILNSITGNSKTLNFKYNESGLRTEKKVEQGGTTKIYTYVWNGDKLVSQSDGTNKFYYFYNESDNAPSGFVYNGTPYFYTKNLQGDVTGIVNMGGVLVTSYTYDAWGNVLSVTGTLASTIGANNPIRYRGYYYDAETGLYYLQSRYYNPEWGRFLNADAYVDTVYYGFGSNVFAYCENNPIVFIDYSGTNSYIFYDPRDFQLEANECYYDLNDYFYKSKYNDKKVKVFKTSTKIKFIEDWKSMGDQNIEAIVIFTHAVPNRIELSENQYLTVSEIKTLTNRCVNGIIVIGCNAGHYNYYRNNVACAFAYVLGTYGVVVASDGTVNINVYLPITRYTSKADDEFISLNNNVKTNNFGWLLYNYNNSSKKYSCYRGYLNKGTTIFNMLKAVDKYWD